MDFNAESEGWLRVEEVHEDGTLVIRQSYPESTPTRTSTFRLAMGCSTSRPSVKSVRSTRARERTAQSFVTGHSHATLALPTGVNKDAVKATYKDGILEVRIPWASEPEGASTKVPVDRS